MSSGGAVGRRGRRGSPLVVLRGILFVLAVAGVFWWMYRGTVIGSRSFLFGGRDLEPVAGAVAFAVTDTDSGTAMLQEVDAAGGEPRVLADDVYPQSAPSWSPDHTRVAYHARVAPGTESGLVLRTVPRTGGEPAQLAAANDDARSDQHPVWSPDGSHLAFLSASRDAPIMSVYVMPAEGGTPRRIGPEPQEYQECFVALDGETVCWAESTGDAEEVAWLSSGELIYRSTVLQDDDPAAPRIDGPAVHALYRVGLDGLPPQLVAEIEHPADQLVPSPDGRFVLYGQVHGTAHVLDLASGQRWEVGRDLVEPSWSPDGRRLLFVRNPAVYTTAFDGSDRVNLTHTHAGEAYGPFVTPVSAVWSPDGRHIAFSGRQGGAGPARLYVANADGTGWTEIFRSDSDRGSDSGIGSLHWLPGAGLP